MTTRSRILSAVSVLLTATLILASCSGSESTTEASTDAVKQDFAESQAEVFAVTIAIAVGQAVYPIIGPTFDDDINDCGEGTFSLNPIAIVNTYTTPQNMSITINSELANNLNFLPSQDGPATTGCQLGGDGGTFDVTVPAGGADGASFTVIGWLAGGSGQFRDTTGSRNVAIGAGGAQWYDYYLKQGLGTNSFESLELNYSNTGGLDPSQNVQTGLFNGLACAADSEGNISLGTPNTAITPFTSDNANAWEFTLNEPICFGFLQPDSATPS